MFQRHRNWVFAGKAGVTVGEPPFDDFRKAFRREISQGVRPDDTADFPFGVLIGDKLSTGGNVGTEIAGVFKGR